MYDQAREGLDGLYVVSNRFLCQQRQLKGLFTCGV